MYAASGRRPARGSIEDRAGVSKCVLPVNASVVRRPPRPPLMKVLAMAYRVVRTLWVLMKKQPE